MSQATDLETLLRQAISKAKASAPRAADDLYRCSSEVAAAVDRVTEGAVKLELADEAGPDGADPVYLLRLNRTGSEAPPTDLGVYALAPAGYPVRRWYSRRKWETQPDEPVGLFPNRQELEDHFRWLISDPESRLVTLVSYLQAYGKSAGAAPKQPRPPRSK